MCFSSSIQFYSVLSTAFNMSYSKLHSECLWYNEHAGLEQSSTYILAASLEHVRSLVAVQYAIADLAVSECCYHSYSGTLLAHSIYRSSSACLMNSASDGLLYLVGLEATLISETEDLQN